jgi:predicted aspartyl protease
MGTFRVEATFRSLLDRDRTIDVSLLVDTGATWTTLPLEAIEALGASAVADRRIRLANGSEETWPVTVVLVTLAGAELPTVCLVGPRGGPALLGAVTLEEFSLSADPVGKRLVPVSGYLMMSTREPALSP